MSATRDDLWRIIDSDVFRGFERLQPIDAGKVRSEWNGVKRPNPRSRFGLGLVNLIRANPKPPPTPPLAQFPLPTALWVQSDSEDIASAKQAGLASCLFQIGGDNWTLLKARATTWGLPWGYWFHCRTITDLDLLLGACRDANADLCGINVEAELETTLTPRVIRERIDAAGFPLSRCCVIAYGWVQNNVRVTDTDMGLVTWLLEMFPQDAPDLMIPHEKWEDCYSHAKVLGVRHPYQLMGVYGNAEPAWYQGSALVDRSIYNANNTQDQWATWLA